MLLMFWLFSCWKASCSPNFSKHKNYSILFPLYYVCSSWVLSLFNLVFHVWKLFLCLVILSCLFTMRVKSYTLIRTSVCGDLPVWWMSVSRFGGSSKENAWYSLWQNSVSLGFCPETDLCPHLLGDAWLIGLWNWGEKGAEGTTTHHTLVY